MKRTIAVYIALLIALLTGCSLPLPEVAPAPASPPAATATAAITGSAPTAVPATPPPPAAVPPATETAAPAPSGRTLPAPTLFEVAWDDRTPFQPGLIAAEQAALAQRPGASVYHIDVHVSDDLTRLQGRQEVRYTNTAQVALAEVYFRLFPNLAGGRTEVRDVAVDGEPATPRYDLRDSVLIVPMSPPLLPGEQVVVAMNFTIQAPIGPGGNYGTFSLIDDILALAHFYPMIAVYEQGGWSVQIAPVLGDVVYSETSYYLVRVDAPASQVVLASGIEIARSSAGGRQQITFAAGPMRDFYLVSSDRYQGASAQVGETTVYAFAPPELAAENELALRYATDALRSFNARFGDYPFTRLDVVGTPTLAGGVEYPGIIVVALAIYDPANRFFESATAHEVAHQWFYSLVGNDQINHPWLDEALTQYATMLYYLDVYGPSGYANARRDMSGRWQRVTQADMPVGLPVAAYDGPSYSGIVYGRGPLFFEALGELMGSERFAVFLRDYVETFKWDIVTPEALKELAEVHCNCDLTPMFEEWIWP